MDRKRSSRQQIYDERILERLNELSFNRKYRSDFIKLKREILGGEVKPEYFTARVVHLGFAEAKQIGWKQYLTKYPLRISGEKVMAIFKKGNVNDHWIVIPQNYSDLKDKWDLVCFFDPSKDFPQKFNPFRYKHPVLPCLGPIPGKKRNIPGDSNLLVIRPYGLSDSLDDSFKIWLEIDTRAEKEMLHKEIDRQISNFRRPGKSEIKKKVGAPKHVYSRLKLIKETWENTCKGKGLSMKKESEIISKNVNSKLDPRNWLKPETIERHYGRMIRRLENKSDSSRQ